MNYDELMDEWLKDVTIPKIPLGLMFALEDNRYTLCRRLSKDRGREILATHLIYSEVMAMVELLTGVSKFEMVSAGGVWLFREL